MIPVNCVATLLHRLAIFLVLIQPLPGNFSELDALVIQALISTPEDKDIDVQAIERSLLMTGDYESVADDKPVSLMRYLHQLLSNGGPSVDHLIQMVYDQALNNVDGNIAAAARLPGISRAQLVYRLKQQDDH